MERRFILGLGQFVLISTLLISVTLCSANAALSQVSPYPQYGFPVASEFQVTVNDTTIPVYNAYTPQVSDTDQLGDQKYWGTFRLCTFAFAGTVNVQVQYTATDSNGRIPIKTFEISPQSNLIQATATLDKTTNTISFSLPSLPNNVSQKLEIRINGSACFRPNPLYKASNCGNFLYILADAPESYAPATTPTNYQGFPYTYPSSTSVNRPIYTKNLIYYGPGVYTPPITVPSKSVSNHNPDPLWAQTITIDDSVTQQGLYLAPGAILSANIDLNGRTKPFHIYGHGFLQNPYTEVQKAAAKTAQDKGTKDTTSSPSNPYALEINGSSAHILVEDINLINSVMYNILFDGSSTSNSVVQNVKCLHSSVNSDGISFYGAINNKVLNSLIANNDNQIVIGTTNLDTSSSAPSNGPSGNLVSGCIFISTNNTGNWLYPQGHSPIDGNNVIENCDVVRTSTAAIIAEYWNSPTTVSNLLVDTIRFQSNFAGDFNVSNYFQLQQLPPNSRTITLHNIALPSTIPSQPFATPTTQYAPTTLQKNTTQWTITFDNVSINGSLLTSDNPFKNASNPSLPGSIKTSYSSDTFSNWQAAAFANPGNQPASATAGPLGSPAGDGVSNLLKYALNMDPTANAYTPGNSSLPVVQIEPINGVDYLTLTFTGVATDATYIVQATSDPSGTWDPIATLPGKTILGVQEVVADTKPISDFSKRFMRLVVSRP